MKTKETKSKKNITVWLVILLFIMIFIAWKIIQILNSETNIIKNYCTMESRNVDACIMLYEPVCGWFNQSKCVEYPCYNTYSNACFACMDEKVEYWTEGVCPQ